MLQGKISESTINSLKQDTCSKSEVIRKLQAEKDDLISKLAANDDLFLKETQDLADKVKHSKEQNLKLKEIITDLEKERKDLRNQVVQLENKMDKFRSGKTNLNNQRGWEVSDSETSDSDWEQKPASKSIGNVEWTKLTFKSKIDQ